MDALETIHQEIAPAFDQEKVEATAMHLAQVYQQGIMQLQAAFKLIDDTTAYMSEQFTTVPSDGLHIESGRGNFTVHRTCHYSSRSYGDKDEEIFAEMKKTAWKVLLDALGIKQIMSVKNREKFEKQLQDGDLPDINAKTITEIVMGLALQAKDFAKDAAKEVFEILRPSWGGYKTNDKFRVGRKVVLPFYCERYYSTGGFRPPYSREPKVNAIDSVFHLLDGKGVLKKYPGPLVQAMGKLTRGEKGETEYFEFRCFKNGNMHVTFKRTDLVEQLNLLATGEKVLGEDTV